MPLKLVSTIREVVCHLIGESLLKHIEQKEVYGVKTTNGAELRWCKSQQPILYTSKHSLEDLILAVTKPELGWRYCMTSPEDPAKPGEYLTDVKMATLVAPNEGFLVLSIPKGDELVP